METTTAIATIPVINPITLEKLYDVEETSEQKIAEVYKKAHAVQPKISDLSVEQRVNEILKIRDYVIENREKILTRIILES